MNSAGPRFSDRLCPVCEKSIPVNMFGQHIMTHEPSQFEGGVSGALELLRESLRISIIEAEGFPNEQKQLLAATNMLDRAAVVVDSLKRKNGRDT